MESNTEKLGQHDRQLEAAFKNLGLNLEEVRSARPEELLQMIATGMVNTANANVRANSAIQIFGRGGQELIPILREQGVHLLENAKKTGDLTGITKESAQAARRWIQDTARLSALFRSVMIPVLDHAEDVVRGVAGAFEAAAAIIMTVVEALGAALTSLGRSLGNVGKLIYDALHNNWAAVLDDAHSVASSFTDEWKGAASDIAGYWKTVWKDFSSQTALPPLPEGGDEGGVVDLPGKPGREKKGKGLSPAELIARAKQPVPEGALPTKMPDPKDAVDAFIQANDAIVRSNNEAAKQNIASLHEEEDERDRAAQEKYRDIEQDSEFEVRMGRSTAQERLAALRQASQEEYQIRLQSVRFQQLLDLNNMQAYQRDLNREVELTRQHNRQITQLNQQAALEAQKAWRTGFQKITDQFNDAVLRWVQSGRGFAQSMAQMMNGITENFVRNVLKMTEQFLVGVLTRKAGQKSEILGDAKTAAANTYSSVSAIPVVGPFLAPPAAAAAFAAVLAFDSFDQGGVVGSGRGVEGIRGAHVPILAEQGERVLTPRQTSRFEQMVNSQSTRNVSGPSIHFAPTVQAYDRNGMRQTLQAHADDLIAIVKTAYQDGRLTA